MEDSIAVMIPIVAVTMSCLLAGFCVWIVSRSRLKRTEALIAIQSRILDKFGTAQEFVDFLKTPEGKTYLTASKERETKQADKALGSVRWGTVLSLLGIGFLVLAVVQEHDLVVPGTLLLSLGVGFLLNSAIAVRLARSWGLMPEAGSVEKAAH